MTLSEMIYEKSRYLPEDKAIEVIDFIDFLLRRVGRAADSGDAGPPALTPEQREAYQYLDKIRIDWQGKPATDRDDANARR